MSIPSFTANDLKTIKLRQTNETLYIVCEEIWLTESLKYTYSIVTFLFQYVLPLIIVTTTNCRICNELNKLPSISKYRFKIQKNNLSDPSTHIIKFKAKTEKTSIKKVKAKEENTAPNTAIENEPLSTSNNTNNNNSNHNIINNNNNNNDGNLVVHDRERFLRSRNLLKAVCLSFAICWLPLLLFNLMLDFFDFHAMNVEIIPTTFLISHLIALFTCIINPILYGLCNTNFKEEIYKIVSCVCVKR